MNLLFLGTGSAKCKKLQEDQIPEGARRCSSMLIDGTVQLDVPIHTYDFLVKRGIDPADVTDIFLTHSHGDHYWKETLLRYAKAGGRKLNLYCNTGAVPYLELTEEEAALLKTLCRFGERVCSAIADYEPSNITRFILDVAAAFNRFYHNCTILGADDPAVRASRVKLTEATKIVLGNAFDLICLSKTEKV